MKEFSLYCLVFTWALVAQPGLVGAQGADSSASAAIDRYLRDIYPADEPGASIIVVHGGEVVHRGAYGKADLELGVRLSPRSVFQIGSVTKQFTAAAILILQERGALSVYDPITKYFPSFPEVASDITLANLLTHTSGLFEYAQADGFWPNAVRLDTTPEALLSIFRDAPLYFPPGSEYRYNNSGYALLGAAIERLSGKSYGDFVRDEIFMRLDMADTQFGGPQIVPNRVTGYSGSSGDYENAAYVSPTQSYAAGALMSTVEDLARWDQALLKETIPGVSYEKMGARFRLNDGTLIDYAYGLTYMNVASREAIGHGGAYSGFNALSFRLTEHDLYVALLINAPGREPGRAEVARRVVEIALGI